MYQDSNVNPEDDGYVMIRDPVDEAVDMARSSNFQPDHNSIIHQNMNMTTAGPETTKQDDDEVPYVTHNVQYGDTLDGLSLQYNVSKREIRTFNKLTTDDIYYLKTLKIPNPNLENIYTSDVDYSLDEIIKRNKVEEIQSKMDKDDRKAAKYYLEINDWDVKRALEEYQADLKFEKDHKNGQAKYIEIKKYKKLINFKNRII